jgi:hypothetical protein
MSKGGAPAMRWWLGGFVVVMAVMTLLTLRLKESQIAASK